jgi:hypothetical protein
MKLVVIIKLKIKKQTKKLYKCDYYYYEMNKMNTTSKIELFSNLKFKIQSCII